MTERIPVGITPFPPPRKRRTVLWIAITVVALLITYLAIGAYAASTVTQIDEDHPKGNKTPQTFGLAFETVRFSARGEELEIAGWYIPNEDSERAMLLIHGRDASKQDAISGNFVNLAASLHNAGFVVLMIDLRGHGESEGERYSFGVYERRDVLGAVDWLLDQGFEAGSIGALGISLGGGATIGAAAEEPAIGLVVVESAFADLYSLIQLKWDEEAGLPRFFLPGVLLMNRLLYGYDPAKVRPVDEITQIAPRPVLIVHCTTDEDVDISHAEALKEALPSAHTWYVEGCEHAEIYRDFPREYEEHVVTFIDENLK